MNYVISGTGTYMDGKTDHIKDVPVGSSKFMFPSAPKDVAAGNAGTGKGGFLLAEASKNSMTFVFYKVDDNDKEAEIYRFVVWSRRKVEGIASSNGIFNDSQRCRVFLIKTSLFFIFIFNLI